MEPEYACALIADPRGRWLLQLRPAGKALAPGQLTCFGGRREPGEDALECVRRELREETGWCPDPLVPAVDLRQGRRFIARFFRGTLDRAPASLRIEPGHAAIVAAPSTLPGLPVSPWHAAVLAAVARGETVVEID